VLACAALLLASAIAVQAGGVEKGRKLIENNAKKICEYTYPPTGLSGYGYKGIEYLGEKKTKDGLVELTYQFTVKGNIKTQTMMMSFFVKDNGDFEFLRPGKSTTTGEPFKVAAAYLKKLRAEMAQRPQVAGDAALTRVVEGETAQQLCERFLKQQQERPK